MDFPSESARCFFVSTTLFQRCGGGFQVIAGELCTKLCSHVGETTARGWSWSRYRDSAIPADVFWKGDRLSQAGPGSMPRIGLGGRQQFWFREEGHVKLLCPPSLPSAAEPKDLEPRAEPHPRRAWGLHPPLGACSVQGELLMPGGCELLPHRAWAALF